MRVFLSLSIIIILSGCISVRMIKIQPKSGNTLIFNGVIDTPDETRKYSDSVQMGTVRFKIFVGESFDNYIAYYVHAIEEPSQNKLQVFIERFDMQSSQFDIENCVAFLEVNFVITQNNNIIFDKKYKTKGTVQQKTGIEIGMNPSLRKATDNAVSKVFEQFSQDIGDEKDPKIKKIIFPNTKSNY